MTLYKNILETIGKTPIVKLNRIPAELKAKIYVKLEAFNPGSSVKDRIGMSMILAAEREGILSMISIPILFHGESIGVIRLYLSQVKKLNEDDVDALKILSEHLGLVIEYNGLRNFLNRVEMAVDSLPARMLKGLKLK